MLAKQSPDPKKIISVILVILLLVAVKIKLSATNGLERIAPANNNAKYYYFEGVTITSENGRAIITGKVSSRRLSYNTTLTCYISDESGYVIHKTSKNIGILSPLNPYEFRFTIESEYYSEQAFKGNCQVRVHGSLITP